MIINKQQTLLLSGLRVESTTRLVQDSTERLKIYSIAFSTIVYIEHYYLP